MTETLIKEYKSIKKIKTGAADFKDLAKICVCLANAQGGEIYISFEDNSRGSKKGTAYFVEAKTVYFLA